jgi:CheY-like chemotaxis protein
MRSSADEVGRNPKQSWAKVGFSQFLGTFFPHSDLKPAAPVGVQPTVRVVTYMHALIIEDEPLLALEIADSLQRIGYDTWDMADTERDAVRQAATKAPDLVVSDIRLRAGNGFDAVNAIRRLLDVPVVFATANHVDISNLARMSVVEKPFLHADLVRAIKLVAGGEDDPAPAAAVGP